MPRKPTRRRQLLLVRPFTFSPFARSVARVASAYKVKHQSHGSKVYTKSSPKSAGYGLIDHALPAMSGQSQSSDEEVFEGVVQADFAFFDPKPDDFHGVKILLQTYLDDEQWDLSGFVDLILGQTTVGTVVKIEEDEDDGIYSVVTAINLGRYKDHKCIIELKEFLLKVCPEKDVLDNLRSVLGEQAQDVGLLVSQCVVNLPLQLLPSLYDALFDEVSWATEDEPTEELQNSFRFKFYLLVSRIYKHKNADQKKGPSSSNEEAIVYIKPEDEIFHKLSSWSFSFPLRTQQIATHELRNYRLMGLVMVVKAEEVSTFRQQLQSLINES
uniref:Putative CDK inhibitor P21 binding protein n=1 Tax=Davidia involucrata TaxID=16924 RepID=A0A5B7AJZ1_DAVIN